MKVSRPVRASATITRGAAAALSGEDAEETGEEVTGKVQALKWENARLEVSLLFVITIRQMFYYSKV